jgi:hypothetical protein
MSLISGLSLGLGLLSSYSQAQGLKAQANAEASMMEYNAGVGEAEAQAIRRKSLYDENILRQEVRSVVSTQTARYGTSGVLMEGSPTEVVLDSIVRGERDALQIREQGYLDASVTEDRAKFLRTQASYTRRAGVSAGNMALMSGLGSAVTQGYSSGLFSSSLTQKASSTGLVPRYQGSISSAYKTQSAGF